jgi:hypothetical protein
MRATASAPKAATLASQRSKNALRHCIPVKSPTTLSPITSFWPRRKKTWPTLDPPLLPQRAPDQQGARVPAMSRQRKQVVARSAIDTVSYLRLQHCTTFGTGAWSMVTALDTLRRALLTVQLLYLTHGNEHALTSSTKLGCPVAGLATQGSLNKTAHTTTTALATKMNLFWSDIALDLAGCDLCHCAMLRGADDGDAC